MKEELLKALKEAMKNKDEIKKDTITLLRSAILQVEKDNQKQLSRRNVSYSIKRSKKKKRINCRL